jgi:hypothetical protein
MLNVLTSKMRCFALGATNCLRQKMDADCHGRFRDTTENVNNMRLLAKNSEEYNPRARCWSAIGVQTVTIL